MQKKPENISRSSSAELTDHTDLKIKIKIKIFKDKDLSLKLMKKNTAWLCEDRTVPQTYSVAMPLVSFIFSLCKVIWEKPASEKAREVPLCFETGYLFQYNILNMNKRL